MSNSIQKRNQEDPTIRFYGSQDNLDETMKKALERRKQRNELRKTTSKPKGN